MTELTIQSVYDELSDKLASLENRLDAADRHATKQAYRVEKAEAKVSDKLSKLAKHSSAKALDLAKQRADDISALYASNMTVLAVVEMALYALWRLPPEQRPVSIENAAIRLVRLMGYGPEYFVERADWSLQAWFDLLATIDEDHMPPQLTAAHGHSMIDEFCETSV